jgi:hypothetical protein
LETGLAVIANPACPALRGENFSSLCDIYQRMAQIGETKMSVWLWIGGSAAMKRIWRLVTYFLAVVYFLVDLIFAGLARPISEWVERHLVTRRLRNWIRSLPPYPSLALFSVPVILFEPIKPIAAYLAATGQFLSATLTFVGGELVKLVLVERLFNLTRDKLLKIPAFAWAYRNYQSARAWLEATEAWQIIRLMGRSVLGHLANWREKAFRSLSLQRDR